MRRKIKKYLVPSQENNFDPHVFRGFSTIILTGLIVLLLLFSVSVSVVVKQSGFLSAVLPSVLIDLTNQDRVENNYQPLEANDKLTLAAQLKANDMAQEGYFSHTSPEGLTPWYWIGLSGYQFIYAGENLAVDFSMSEDVNTAWLNSAGHAANILSPNFTEIGIATAEGEFQGHRTVFVVQMFGTPAPIVTSVPSEPKQPIKEIVVVEEKQIDNQLLVVAENKNIEPEVVQDTGTVQQAEAPGYERYTNWYTWLILNPVKLTEYALYVAAAVIMLALLLSITTRHSLRNPKGLAYGIFILVVLLIVIYLNRTGLVTETIFKYFN